MAGEGGILPAMLQAFLDGPATPAPNGITSNLDNVGKKNTGIFAFAILCVCMVSIAVALRLYTRIVIAHKLHVEDCLGFAGYLSFILGCWAVFAYEKEGGFSVHQWDHTGRSLVNLSLIAWIAGISYCLTMLFLKTAILLSWMRTFAFQLTAPKTYWLSLALVACNVGVYFGGTFGVVFQCKPVAKTWHFWLAGTCADRKWRNSVGAGINVAIDVFIFVVPQRSIWGLSMNWGRKLGMSVVFSIGLLVVATATGRFYSTFEMDEDKDLLRTTDWTYTFSHFMLWSFAELVCIFFVFCVPALPKLVREDRYISHIRASLRSWTGRKPTLSGTSPKMTSWPRTIGGASVKRPGHSADDLFRMQTSLTELPVIPTTDHASGVSDGRPRTAEMAKIVEDGHDDESGSDSSNNLFADYQRHWVGN